MNRVLAFSFGVFCHGLFLVTFAYMVGFVGGFLVPKSIDSPAGPLTLETTIVIDLALLALFAIPHSVMARPAFKVWWTKFVPGPIERSVYVLIACLCIGATMAFWQPFGPTLWSLEGVPAVLMWALFATGWLGVPLVSLMINHFDLFGTRQVWLYLKQKPYTFLKFHTPMLYRVVRHPLYVGWMIAFWATPTMTAGHALFAAFLTIYMLVAIRFEERDLVDVYGEQYESYRRDVPALVPSLRRKRGRTVNATSAASPV